MLATQNFNILRFEELSSTNNKLKELKQNQNLEEFTVVQTYRQTAGKGQAGNSWESEEKKNLTFSTLLKPSYVEILEQFIISKAVALGITDVFNSIRPGFSIKWPNDIYYNNKKIGGILIENAIRQDCISESVIGIGLNINQTKFVSDAPNPISLKSITGKNFDLDEMLLRTLERIAGYVNMIKNGESESLDKLYLDQLYRKSGYHLYNDANGEFRAQITGINNYGHLELTTQEGERRSYAFKEVEFVIGH